MKRYMVVMAALAALGVVGYVANQLWAQQPGTGPAPANTKVGMVNLLGILKGYNKQKVYTGELEQTRVQFEKKDVEYKATIQAWEKVAKENPAKVEEAQAAIKGWTRKLQDNTEEFKLAMGKKVDVMQVQMYKEIEEAVKRFAVGNGYQMIFLYSEPPEADKYVARNVDRKMTGSIQSAGVVPLYAAAGMDVTNDVVNLLNQTYPAAATPPASGGSQ